MCFLFLIINFNFSPSALHRLYDPIQINCRHKLKLSFEFSYLNEFLSLATWDELPEIITSLLSIGSRVLKRFRLEDNVTLRAGRQASEIFYGFMFVGCKGCWVINFCFLSERVLLCHEKTRKIIDVRLSTRSISNKNLSQSTYIWK